MSFIRINFQKISSSLNDREPRMWTYRSTTDSFATISASGYFNEVVSEITNKDFVYIHSTDVDVLQIFTITGQVVTVAYFPNAPITPIVYKSYVTLNRSFVADTSSGKFYLPLPIAANTFFLSIAIVLETAMTGDTVNINLKDVNADINEAFVFTAPPTRSVGYTQGGIFTPGIVLPIDDHLYWDVGVTSGPSYSFSTTIILESIITL